MERLILDKVSIITILKEHLENHYDIELADIMFNDLEEIVFSYLIIYKGEKRRVIKILDVREFINLLKSAVVEVKHFINPSVNLIFKEDVRCMIYYQLTEKYSRGRKK